MSTNNPVSGEQVASDEPLGTPPDGADPSDEHAEDDEGAPGGDSGGGGHA